jgi:predicted GNAT family acetyltransferase
MAGMKNGMTADLRNNQELSRYELVIDDQLVGIAEYHLVGEVVVFPHTEIELARRGQGLGAQLVQYALDDVRASKRRAKAECWYVADFIAEHPEYADLTS